MSRSQRAVTTDERVRRTVMAQDWFGTAIEFRDDALGQHFSQLDSPLVERIDVPHDALRENGVLVEGHQLAECSWRQLLREDGVRRAIAFEHPMRNERLRCAFSSHLIRCLAE